MVDPHEFPLGDAQTWVRYTQRWEKKEEKLLSQYLKDPLLGKKLLNAGIRPKKDKFEETLYLRDTVSGLPFIKNNSGFSLYLPEMVTFEHDVIDTCYYREKLHGSSPVLQPAIRTPLTTGSAIDRFAGIYGVESTKFLSAPIKDYEASTHEECKNILDKIHNTLSRGPYFKRLWLRGQRREYSLVPARDEEICRLLGFGDAGVTQPSLIPSIGRYAKEHPDQMHIGFAFAGPNHFWKKPFIVWVIRQNPEWLEHYPEFREKVEKALRSNDDAMFSQILVDIQFDSRVPDEMDDFRQWFFAYYKYGIWVWVLQQYGYLSSMIDLTWDLDTALFFTQAKIKDSKFQLISPEVGRVIYVFAQSKESGSFVDLSSISWSNENWNKHIPARIAAQRCGGLLGSTYYRQNLYGHLVVARIRLQGSCSTTRSIEDVFPSLSEDLLFRTLRDAVPKPEGVY